MTVIYICSSLSIKEKMNPKMSEANRDKKLSDASVHKLPTRFSLSYLGANQAIFSREEKI